MQYQVPQFIEVEDKLFGNLTARQFVYLAGAGGVCLGAFSIFNIVVASLISAPFVALALALSFYKMDGQSFLKVMENAFGYFVSSKLYLWSSEHPRTRKEGAKMSAPLPEQALVPKLSESKLRELSWSLNIKDNKAMGNGEGDII